MHTYLDAIKQASLFFPAIALIFSIPYLIYNYKKYGSILSLRIWIIYSFILYLLCVYCLIILPLPSPEKAQTLTGYHLQLNPFNFIFDIIKNTKINLGHPKTLLTFINNWGFLTTVFNIFMTLPFGFYLRYYFQNRLKQIIVKTFLLSLFFELTQLSGLYFIYSGNYRLFDVDDLITNTLGGVFGFLLANLLANFLPTRAEIDQKSFDRSKKISLLRRLIALTFDSIASILFIAIVSIPLLKILNLPDTIPVILLTVIIFLTLFSTITHGQTPGFFMTNLKVTPNKDLDSQHFLARYLRFFIRYTTFVLQFIFVPLLVFYLIQYLFDQKIFTGDAIVIVSISSATLYLLYLFITSILVALRKPLFYEKLSDTSLESTATNKNQKSPSESNQE